jgi:hypothetical protein
VPAWRRRFLSFLALRAISCDNRRWSDASDFEADGHGEKALARRNRVPSPKPVDGLRHVERNGRAR